MVDLRLIVRVYGPGVITWVNSLCSSYAVVVWGCSLGGPSVLSFWCGRCGPLDYITIACLAKFLQSWCGAVSAVCGLRVITYNCLLCLV